MRFLVRVVPASVSREKLLDSVKAISKAFGVEPRNPKWTSYGGLELDVFSPTKADFELLLSALRPVTGIEFVRDLNVAPPHKEEAETLAEARALFNAERYWECHEVLESLWRMKQGEEKSLLQGIILVCAAFVHRQKGEQDVAFGVLRRAVKQLYYPGQVYGGFDVARLRKHAENILAGQEFEDFRV